MSPKTAKISLTVIVLSAAFGALFWQSLAPDMEYYKHVDEVMSAPNQWYGKRLQVHGFVAKDSLLQRRGTLDYRFKVENKGSIVQASYTGIVPDTFKEGSEVVLKGTLGPHGFAVEPNGVMAKCPSKYKAEAGPVGKT